MLCNCSRGAAALGALLGLALVAGCEKPAPVQEKLWRGYASPPDTSPPAFIGSTSKLSRTVVLPTLDTPIPDGKSAIWCSAFQLAWNAFRKKSGGAPIQVRNAEVVSGRLNAARQSEADLRPDEYFISVGPAKKVLDAVKQELPRRFPGIGTPEIDVPPVETLAAFALLKAGVRYTSEFRDYPKGFEFVDSAGERTNVRSFGILPMEVTRAQDSPEARGQVALLWQSGSEFALDLCRDSKPNQIVLATLNRKGTLAELLTVEEAQRQKSKVPASSHIDELELLVPNMSWRIDHRFQELEGRDKTLINGPLSGWPVLAAWEEIQFKLDRRGAEITAGGMFATATDGNPITRLFFNRPFLIYLKKRDARHPFFAMWVDNAELMQMFSAQPPKNGKK